MRISPETWQAIVSGERGGLGSFLLRRGLWLARLPYALGVGVRNQLFDWRWRTIQRVEVPIVSIGNLTLGGTGKTPCVEYVAGFYRQHDWRVAILSRGYHAEGGRNDEAMLLEENLPDVPHLQNRDRAASARIAIDELESEILVLDDGFQHRRLHRDLDLVLIDATNPWGGGYLFPRGALREPVGSLKRAHMVMITRADRAGPGMIDAIRARVNRIRPMPISLTRHEPIELIRQSADPLPVEHLRGRPVAAFCGIGNPNAFRATLEGLGADVIESRVYPDHHRYTRGDVDDLERWAAATPRESLVVTTQKDFVKLRVPELGSRPLAAVRIGLAFLNGQDDFDSMLLRLVNK